MRERTKVSPSTATVEDVEALARSYTSAAIEALADIAVNGDKEAARVAAANSILERGHGKISGADEGKKLKRQANAQQAAAKGGKFSPRPGPSRPPVN